MKEDPIVLQGGIAVDDRGEVGFVNDFRFEDVKRFYTVSNHGRGFVRAWHGHRHESKYVMSVRGAFLVCCVKIDNWETPSPDLAINRFVLTDKRPSVVYVPAGYVNGFMSLTDEARLMFFSTALLQDSIDDDIRFPARFWNPWIVEER
ncbi:MAG: dTDP-4-dehydrorhamnose 3,5-epimerase family protein [Pseudomonadota bacterium]